MEAEISPAEQDRNVFLDQPTKEELTRWVKTLKKNESQEDNCNLAGAWADEGISERILHHKTGFVKERFFYLSFINFEKTHWRLWGIPAKYITFESHFGKIACIVLPGKDITLYIMAG